MSARVTAFAQNADVHTDSDALQECILIIMNACSVDS